MHGHKIEFTGDDQELLETPYSDFKNKINQEENPGGIGEMRNQRLNIQSPSPDK